MEIWRRRFIVIVGFFEALLFSGCLFGWASLVHVLQHEGVYSHLCLQQEIGLRSVLSDSDNDIITVEPASTIFSQKLLHSISATTPISDSDIYNTTSHYELADFIQDETVVLFNEDPKSNKEVVTCTAQDKEFTLVYTVAAVMYGLTSILIGFSLDRFGLWVTRISASVMASTGFFCLAFASSENPWLLWPALNLVGLGTNQLRLSCFQFANLYPKHRATIILMYGAAYSISTVVFLIVQYGYEIGISYRTSIMILCGISIMTFPVTFLMPRMKVEEEEDHVQPSTKSLTKSDNNFNDDSEKGKSFEWSPSLEKTEGEISTIQPKQPGVIPLGASFFTLSSFLHFYWQWINSFLVLFYSASFNAWAKKTTSDMNEVAFYNKMMGLCQLIAPVFIPIAGMATDCLIKRGSKHEDKVERLAVTLEAPAYTLILSTVAAGAMLFCKMFLRREAIYVSLILIAMSRPLLVGSLTTYLRIRFHAEHFNRLNGIHGTLVSILCLVQYPLFVWMYSSEESFLAAHLLLMGLLLLSFSSPGHLLFRSLSRKYAKDQIAQKLAAQK